MENGRQPFTSRKDSRAESAIDAAASSPGSISAKGSNADAGDGSARGAGAGTLTAGFGAAVGAAPGSGRTISNSLLLAAVADAAPKIGRRSRHDKST